MEKGRKDNIKGKSSPKTDVFSPEKKRSGFNENIFAFFMIILGIFLSLALITPAMGIVGQGVSYLIRALIGELSLLVSLIFLLLGAARLLFPEKISFEKIPIDMVAACITLCLLIYSWIHAEEVMERGISLQALREIWTYSSAGDGIGVMPYLFTILITKLIGKAGLILITLALMALILFYYFRVLDLSFFTWRKSRVEINNNLDEYPPSKIKMNIWKRCIGWIENFIFEETEENTQSLLPISSPEKNNALLEMKYDPNNLKINDEEPKKIPTYEEFFQGENADGKESNENLLEDNWENEQSIQERDIIGKEEEQQGYIFEDLDKLKADGKDLHQRNLEGSSVENTETVSDEEEKGKDYVLPPLWLLKEKKHQKKDMTERNKQARLLEETLGIFGIEATVTNIAVGPSITRYELQPKAGTKVSKIVNLADDLSLALASQSIRIEAPIPGKSLVGIEVANKTSEMVDFRSVIETQPFKEAKSMVSFALGKDVTGDIIVADLAAMPHLLVAGSTGSGKSVCINTIICSILCRANPDQVKFIMIDPKMVELANYNDIPHLLIPVVTDMKKAPYALNWAVGEMNRRYKLFSENRVKDIFSYNEKFPEEPLSNIVIIVDELADLMLVSPKDVEDAICRIAQMARACGMHLVIATQRPSVDVITGLIKANIPSRIAFAVSSQTDSRTILDMGGAEKLLGKGDSLYYPIGMNKPKRVQGAFISEKEVQNIVAFIKEQSGEREDGPDIIEEAKSKAEEEQEKFEEDPLLKEVIKFAIDQGKVSTSLVQRRFRIGYNRASRMVEELEFRGIIGPSNGVRPREVLVDSVEEDQEEIPWE